MPKQLSVNYSLNTENKWIYCNYPEGLTTEHFGHAFADSDSGSFCLNQQTVNGTGQIFYSYNAMDLLALDKTEKCYFGISVYNPSSSAITFTRKNYGHSNSKDDGWDGIPFKSWERFFQSSSKQFTIPSNKAVWICDEVIPSCIFTGNLRYTTSGSAIITAFIYKTKSKIPDATSIYPYDKTQNHKQYSGYGNGYFFTASEITIKLSDIVKNNGVYFETNNGANKMCTINGSSTTNELIPIHIAGTSDIAQYGAKSPLHNIANWCAQYFFPIKLINDLGGTRQVRCWIESMSKKEQYPFVNCDGKITHEKLTFQGDTHIFKEISVTNTATFNYQFIFGTNSSGYVKHMFRVL